MQMRWIFLLFLTVAVGAGCLPVSDAPIDACELTVRDISDKNIVVSGMFSTDGLHSSALRGSSCERSISLQLKRDEDSREIVAVGGNDFLSMVYRDVHSGEFRSYEVVVRGRLQAGELPGELRLVATEMISYAPALDE